MHPNRVSGSPGGDILHALYVDAEMSYAEIGQRYGVSNQTVMRWVKKAGITPRTRSEATKLGSPKRVITPEYRAKLAENLKKARANVTELSRKKQGLAQRGRTAPNKGKKWTPEERATHMAVRTTDEYREKIAVAHRGEKNGNWKDGASYHDPDLRTWTWKRARAACYERDGWTCQDCRVKCHNGVRIQAHHIIPRRHGGGDELENLVTLCASCHRKREAKFADALIA